MPNKKVIIAVIHATARSISFSITLGVVPSVTYLAIPLNIYVGVFLHVSVFATTIDRTLDEGMFIDGHVGLGG